MVGFKDFQKLYQKRFSEKGWQTKCTAKWNELKNDKRELRRFYK